MTSTTEKSVWCKVAGEKTSEWVCRPWWYIYILFYYYV